MENQAIARFLARIKNASDLLDVEDDTFYTIDVVQAYEFDSKCIPGDGETAISFDNGNYVITFGDLRNDNIMVSDSSLTVCGAGRYEFYEQKLITRLGAETHMVDLVHTETESAFKLHTEFMDEVKSTCSTLRSDVSMAVQSAELPSDAPSEIYVFVDAEGGLWPYNGTVLLRKKSIGMEHDYLCTTDMDVFSRASEESIVYELYGAALENMSKFYRTELVYVGYTGSCGSVFDWANYDHTINELLSCGLIKEGESVDHFSFAMDSDFAIIKLVKK